MPDTSDITRIVIMGAAGRDFHNFNVVYRDDPRCRVIAFTATQIPGISARRYPPSLAGPLYPEGIPIFDETSLKTLCSENDIDEVVFAYSDVEHIEVMHRASIALAAGANFKLLSPRSTYLVSRLPVIAVCAVRTGAGKSQVTRWLARRLGNRGIRSAILRHPMPYGDIAAQAIQRFATTADLDDAHCTIEEREEYEPHIAAGGIVFAGVDYAEIIARAEHEADVILWDGGNNDAPFVRSDLLIALADPLRPGHETTHHPGETVLRMADIVLMAKCNAATQADIERVENTVRQVAPRATIIRGNSLVTLDDASAVTEKRVIVVDDGPTLTHGGMSYGAGYIAALEAGAAEIVDPRRSAAGEIADVYRRYPHLGPVLPAVGYSQAQMADLSATIAASQADVVVTGTPVDLASLLQLEKPVVRARYEFSELVAPGLGDMIDEFVNRRFFSL